MRRKLVVGNWKMHGSRAGQRRTAGRHAGGAALRLRRGGVRAVPYLTETAATLAGSDLRWGAQDCSAHEQGAYTGEVSAGMLAEFGCRYVIVGHSERRAYHGESDRWWPRRRRPRWPRASRPSSASARRWPQREAGETEAWSSASCRRDPPLAHCAGEIVVAYEPVWAIGTGRTATPEQAQAVHAVLRAQLQAATGHGRRHEDPLRRQRQGRQRGHAVRQPDIDGGLIGGASLKAADFIAICRAAA
jgi:triosephosphate isomerase